MNDYYGEQKRKLEEFGDRLKDLRKKYLPEPVKEPDKTSVPKRDPLNDVSRILI